MTGPAAGPHGAARDARHDPVLLLGPDGERPFDAAALEREMRAMWKSARSEGGALYRAALANVIFPLDAERHAPLDPVLSELTRRHPSRLFRLQRAPAGDGGPLLRARATALCHVRPGGGGLVCSEQIVLMVGPGTDGLVPSAVASLLVGDLPVILIRLDTSLAAEPTAALEAMADLILEDSAACDDAGDMSRIWEALAEQGSGRVRDIAWARLLPWREILAEVFDQPEAASAHEEIQDVTIRHGGAAPPAGAWLLAGWLGTRLHWTLRDREGARFHFDGPKRAAALHFVRDEDESEPVVVGVRARSGAPRPLDVSITHRGHDAAATLDLLAPTARSLERTFRYREFAACLIGEIQRHAPNESLEHAARLAARLASAPSPA